MAKRKKEDTIIDYADYCVGVAGITKSGITAGETSISKQVNLEKLTHESIRLAVAFRFAEDISKGEFTVEEKIDLLAGQQLNTIERNAAAVAKRDEKDTEKQLKRESDDLDEDDQADVLAYVRALKANKAAKQKE